MSASAVHLRRLFFGLWPDEATREALHRATRSAVRHCGGKPVRPENFHLTLAFLGNVPDERVEAITSAVRALSPAPMTLTLDRVGWFEAPQVLWIGSSQAPKGIARLASDIWRAMATAGLEPDVRPFHPHVTLARKLAAPPELVPPRPVGWTVEGFSLLESETDAKGARYRVLTHFGVGGA